MTSKFFNLENSYLSLSNQFYAHSAPTPASQPKLLAWNEALAKDFGLLQSNFSDKEKALYFTGSDIIPGSTPVSLAYAGHQFGRFVATLGDGRAHLLGDFISPDGKRYDIQLKGSGITPFSRNGDGKSALGPVLREYLVSEAMHAMGIPTTRALAAASTGEFVFRDTPKPGAVFTRVAPSHIRVGTFEYFAARGDTDSLQKLLLFAAARHFPELPANPTLPLAFLQAVVRQQADLIAQWMSVGFIHGVMNTDNTAVGGFTIDFGPCAFMDEYNSNKVFSFIDKQGRYAYSRQPLMAQWNLARLAQALLCLSQENTNEVATLCEQEVQKFSELYEAAWLKRMAAKIGIMSPISEDAALIKQWLSFVENGSLDFTLSFRVLANMLFSNNTTDGAAIAETAATIGTLETSGAGNKNDSHDLCYSLPQNNGWHDFRQKWYHRVLKQNLPLAAIAEKMNSVNPLYIPRNHILEAVISEATEGNFSLFQTMQEILLTPYNEKPQYLKFSQAPTPQQRVLNTFCGT